MLEQEGYHVDTVANGLEGIKKVQEGDTDLVILDVMLPGLDGYEVCYRLRIESRTAKLPILMISAKVQEVDKATGLRVGANEYLTKPADPEQVLTSVKALLGEDITARSEVQKVGKATELKTESALSVGFVGSSKGVGTTTVAVNTAIAMAQSHSNVLLVDLVPCSDSPTPGDLDYLLMDMSAGFSEVNTTVLGQCDVIVLVAGSGQDSLTFRAMDTLRYQAGIGRDRIVAVVVDRDGALSQQNLSHVTPKLESAIGFPLLTIVPQDVRPLLETSSPSIPIVLAEPQAPAAAALGKVANWILSQKRGNQIEIDQDYGESFSPYSKWFGSKWFGMNASRRPQI